MGGQHVPMGGETSKQGWRSSPIAGHESLFKKCCGFQENTNRAASRKTSGVLSSCTRDMQGPVYSPAVALLDRLYCVGLFRLSVCGALVADQYDFATCMGLFRGSGSSGLSLLVVHSRNCALAFGRNESLPPILEPLSLIHI